jgi:integrase
MEARWASHIPELDLALHTGLRLSEMFGLDWQDVDLARCLVLIRRGKNGDSRYARLNSVAQRYAAIPKIDEEALTEAIVALASEYGRYGYRRITALLQGDGWQVGTDRVQRIWRREGLKVPQKQRPRRRLWLNDGSCIRLRPERANHVWSYDFVSAMTHDGRTLRMLTLI